MKVTPVPVRDDNYAYLLIDESSNKAAAVDPWDVPKVKQAADAAGVEIIAALTTHHHHDHSGGNPAFAQQYPGVPIYGGSQKVQAFTDLVSDKDQFKVGAINIKCHATPCHTQDSICYYATDDSSHPGAVFTGDTLFIGGCGRFFEGNAQEMIDALTYLGTLPDQTIVCTGHEYTKGNLSFAQTVEPGTEGIQKLQKLVEENEITNAKSTIGDEKAWNPFMRLHSDAIKQKMGGGSDVEIMQALRESKNNHRG